MQIIPLEDSGPKPAEAQLQIYFWPDIDFGLRCSGHAVAIAPNFGEACQIVAEYIASEYHAEQRAEIEADAKNKLLTLRPMISAVSSGFVVAHKGHD